METPPLTDATVLVTGGLGFVGSHLVDALAPHNDVRVLDDCSTGERDRLHPEATLLEGDIRDPTTLERATRDVDAIFHQAAVVSVERSVEEPLESNRTNLEASLALLERAREEDARVVAASSAAIYGHPESLPISETDRKEPTSPYGIQKLALDHYVRRFADLYDLPAVALRYFNVFGPRQRGPYSGVISTFLEQARAGDPITIEGDGEQTRDFVHVSDVVRANLLAATTDRTGEAFNVGTGNRTSIRSLAETIREAVGSASPIVHRDPRPGDVRHSRADPSKAADALDFDARVGLEAGIEDLVSADDGIAGGDAGARDRPTESATDGGR